MFDTLTDKLGAALNKLTRRGALTEADVTAAMRDVRVALLEADVALPVVKDFIAKVSEKAVGEAVIKSVTPGQLVVKIVHDELVAMLGGESAATGIDLAAPAPVAVLMVGLQGSGKTTTTGKIANRLQNKDRKRVLMVSLDTYRPAAQEQLAILGKQAGVISLPIVAGQQPLEIAKRGLEEARRGGFDVVLFDTAGRLTIDEAMMTEVAALRDLVHPHETLLVTDAMIGQDSVTTAKSFNEKVGITGIVLTRVDGDARGGAALSMRAVTGRPSSSSVSAKRSTPSTCSVPSVSRAASSAWATSSASSKRRSKPSTRKRPINSRRAWPKASSTSTTCCRSSSRSNAWAI